MDVDGTFQDGPSAAHRKFEADQDRGNRESSRAARGQERLAEGVAERLAEELGAGDNRPNEHGCSRSRVGGDVSQFGGMYWGVEQWGLSRFSCKRKLRRLFNLRARTVAGTGQRDAGRRKALG